MKRLSCAAILALSFTGPAFGQAWIGQMAAENARTGSRGTCLNGLPLPAEELAEAKAPAITLLQRFWESTLQPAKGAPGFQPVGTAKWIRGAVVTRRAQMAALVDPLKPNAASELVAEPLSFVRAGAEPLNDARGVWKIVSKAEPAKIEGYYLVTFERFMLKWGIATISVFGPDEAPAAARPFCMLPGDIEQHAIRTEERRVRKAAKDAIKAARAAKVGG